MTADSIAGPDFDSDLTFAVFANVPRAALQPTKLGPFTYKGYCKEYTRSFEVSKRLSLLGVAQNQTRSKPTKSVAAAFSALTD